MNFADNGGSFPIALTAAAIGIGKFLLDLGATYLLVDAAWDFGIKLGEAFGGLSQNAQSKPNVQAPSVPATGGSTPASPGGPDWDNNGNNRPNLGRFMNRNEANEFAKRMGFKNAEQFKASEVGERAVSKFNIRVEKVTGRVWLEAVKGSTIIPTSYIYWG